MKNICCMISMKLCRNQYYICRYDFSFVSKLITFKEEVTLGA